MINDTLSSFKLAGNFFRATSDGGVLEHPDTPLELGEDYWLATQTQLREPAPDLLKIVERRADRAWFVYRIELQNAAGDVTGALTDIKAYLQREVIRPRPRIHLIWPTPYRFDPDGVPVFDTSVRAVLVRSTDGVPQYFSTDDRPINSEQIGDSLFALVFDGKQSEVFAGVQDGALRRLRFAAGNLSRPEGVTIRLNEATTQAFEPSATSLLGSSGDIHLSVPAHRVWRSIKINGAVLRPLPDGNDHVVTGPIQALNAGAFGQVQLPNAQGSIAAPPSWHAPLAKLVAQLVGPHAARRLEHVSNKAQLLHWAQHYSAHAILPRLLSAISSEVDRGIP